MKEQAGRLPGTRPASGMNSEEITDASNGVAFQSAGTDKVIRITCEGAAMMPLAEIKELQGQLKSLSRANYEKLKALILGLGFSFPLEIAVVNGKPLGVVDGHQRLRTIRNMVEKEGYSLPGGSLPVCWKYCKERNEAGKAILAAISQFGRTDEEGLYSFVHDFELDPKILQLDYDIPNFNTEKFVAGYYGDVLADTDGVNAEDAEPGPMHECPKCGHRW